MSTQLSPRPEKLRTVWLSKENRNLAPGSVILQKERSLGRDFMRLNPTPRRHLAIWISGRGLEIDAKYPFC